MTQAAAAFGGSVPQVYHSLLVPLVFLDYARDLVARLELRADGRTLELACGTGVVTRELLRAMPPGKGTLLATDLNPAMLEVARQTLAADPRVTFQVVDACTLPFEAASFDALACQFGVMFFPDKPAAMREARRVLKPGGRYCFNVWDALAHNPVAQAVHQTLAECFPADPPRFLEQFPYGWSDRAEIERTVREGGFTNVSIETLAFPSSAPTAAEAAKAWLEGTPLKPALAERGASDTTAVRERVTRVLAQRFGDHPCASTIRAVVVTAS